MALGIERIVGLYQNEKESEGHKPHSLSRLVHIGLLCVRNWIPLGFNCNIGKDGLSGMFQCSGVATIYLDSAMKHAVDAMLCILECRINGVPSSQPLADEQAVAQRLCLLALKKKTKLHGLSPRANHTDRATAACRRSDWQLFAHVGCHVVSVTDPYGPYSWFSRQEPL
jgi:hypothetical protein